MTWRALYIDLLRNWYKFSFWVLSLVLIRGDQGGECWSWFPRLDHEEQVLLPHALIAGVTLFLWVVGPRRQRYRGMQNEFRCDLTTPKIGVRFPGADNGGKTPLPPPLQRRQLFIDHVESSPKLETRHPSYTMTVTEPPQKWGVCLPRSYQRILDEARMRKHTQISIQYQIW
jgi:hypothetical protein